MKKITKLLKPKQLRRQSSRIRFAAYKFLWRELHKKNAVLRNKIIELEAGILKWQCKHEEMHHALQKESQRIADNTKKHYFRLLQENEFLRGRLGELPERNQKLFDSQQPILPSPLH